MGSISFEEFKKIYLNSVNEVYEYWTPKMQWELATHCYSWNPDLFDFKTYLEASAIRFYKAYRSFSESENVLSVCDIGGFWGVSSITLKSLGYNVIMTESLKYYGHSFDPIFKCISEKGVTIIDYDPFQEEAAPSCHFDVITVMAVLEHYPHSLKQFMRNITAMMNPAGRLYIEVPNVAYWPKRINFLLGRTPHTQLRDIFNSEIPFIGHHHEFTISELRDLAELSNLKIIQESYYNYSVQSHIFGRLIKTPLEALAQAIIPSTRECLAVLCKKTDIV